MLGMNGSVPTPEGPCLCLATLKHFLCLLVMGLETDEVNELITVEHSMRMGG